MLIIYTVICLCILRDFGVKAKLRIELENTDILTVDQSYFDPEKTDFHVVVDEDTDETSLSSTLEIIKQLPEDTNIHIESRGLLMGKYTVQTGLNMVMTFCQALDEPIGSGPFFALLGFSRDLCPPGPGVYFQEGYQVPVDFLPDNFPENKYLVIFEMTSQNKMLFALNIYVSIQIE